MARDCLQFWLIGQNVWISFNFLESNHKLSLGKPIWNIWLACFWMHANANTEICNG